MSAHLTSSRRGCGLRDVARNSAVCCCACLLLSAISRAQLPALPSSADTPPMQRAPASPAASLDIPPAPGDGPSVPAAPPGADTITFVLRAIQVKGASPAVAASLTAPHAGKIGQQITLATVYDIADAMTRQYRKAGNFLSVVIVPAQRIEQGQVTLHLYEGKLSRVEVRGPGSDRRGLAKETADQVLAAGPVTAAAVERQLLLLNDLPGLTARGTLVPSAEGLGFADLIVDTSQPRYRAELGADNRSGRYLGPGRYTARLALNDVLGLQDATQFEYATAVPADRYHTWTIENAERLSPSGLAMNVSYTDYRSRPNLGEDFAAFNLETNSKTAFADLAYPLIRSRLTNLSLRTGLRYHDGATDSSFAGTATRDRVTTGLIGMTFDHADAGHGVSTVDFEVDQGLHTLGASSAGDPTLSRPGGRPDATKATLYIARLQDLGANFSVLLAATGQYAASRLLLPDEFAYGGEYFGRAYDAAEFVGDSGAAGKLEVRYTWNAPYGLMVLPYGFYEAGWVSRRDSTNTAVSSDSALSAGCGLRLTLGTHLSGYVEVDEPINHVVAAEGNRSTRVFGGLKVSF
jgi:hemolysin activation/secretion protein